MEYKQYCYKCRKLLNPKKIVWLELNMKTNIFSSELCPENESQGMFPFGPDCAKKVDGKKQDWIPFGQL